MPNHAAGAHGAALRAALRASLCVTLCAAAGACAGTEAESSDVSSREKLVDGQPTRSRPEIAFFNIITDAKRGFCTATLIRRNVVITAAHCIDYLSGVQGWGNIQLDSGSDYPIIGAISFSEELGAADIALMELSGAVPGVLATPTYIESSVPPVGTPVTIFGYGCTERQGMTGGGTKRRISFNVGTRSSNLCPGDSGGPVVRGEDGGIVWINSAYYDTVNGADIYGEAAVNSEALNALADMISTQGTAATLSYLGAQGGGGQQGGGQQGGGQQGGGQQGGGQQGGGQQGGGAPIYSCAELWQCALDCNANEDCISSCGNRTQDQAAVTQAINLETCINNSGCADVSCVEQRCYSEVVGCGFEVSGGGYDDGGYGDGGYGDGGAGGGGAGGGGGGAGVQGWRDCSSLYDCVAACADDSCTASCFAEATQEAQGRVSALITCYNGNSCQRFDDYLCMQQECPADFQACFQ